MSMTPLTSNASSDKLLHMSQDFKVRNIPDVTYRQLRLIAANRAISVNAAALEAMYEYVETHFGQVAEFVAEPQRPYGPSDKG